MGRADAATGAVTSGAGGTVGAAGPPTRRPPPDDLAPIAHRAQRGDEDAFAALYTAVQPGLLRYLRALVGDDAEDVASEAWLQIARDLRALREPGGFRGWAATIARNRALDHIRQRRRRPVVSVPVEELVEVPDGRPDLCDEAVASVSTDAAVALIASLPRDQAEAVLLRVVVGLDAETAARVLGKRAGAVRVAAHRGLRRLAARLDREPTLPRQRAYAPQQHPTPPTLPTRHDRTPRQRLVTPAPPVTPEQMR